MKEDYQIPFKKLTLYILWNPVPFAGQAFENQKRSVPVALQVTKQVQKNSFINDALPDKFNDVI